MHVLECMTQNVFVLQQDVSGHHQTHLVRVGNQGKKEANNAFEPLAIKTYC
jgi:hypothetical protein